MSNLATIAFVTVGLWLGILTLILILVIRQIGLLSVRVSLNGGRFSFADDGPKIGSRVSDEVTTALPTTKGRLPILVLSASCTPCRELATKLSSQDFNSAVLALVPGDLALADGIAALLPDNITTVRDPIAGTLAEALQVKSTPFAVIIEDGVVVDKAYLYQVADLIKLVNAAPVASVDKTMSHSKEVGYVR